MNVFTTQRRVQFSQTDMAGIVHFSNYYKWMEEVEHDFFRSIELSIMQRQSDGTYLGWPRVNASCHFEAPIRYEELIELRLRIERVGVKSLTYVIEFYRDGRRLAHGRMKAACCICREDGTLTSVAIPETYLERLKSFVPEETE